MEIVVCVKQVPDTTEVKIDPVTNTLIRQGVPSIVNPFDKNAVEAALVLKEKHGGKVRHQHGPAPGQRRPEECLAMGADAAILLRDRAFGGADTLATSYTLAAAIRKLGQVDLVFCGKQAIDGDTAQVGPEIAEHLGIPQVTYVSKIDIDGTTVRVEREHEDGYEIIETQMPAMLTFVKSANEPRYPTVKGTMRANRAEIPVWTVNDLDVDAARLGLKGSPTQVRKIFTPKQRTQGVLIQKDTAREAVAELIAKLAEAKIV
jgi:electron transfer flavoprotein beta subunit